MVKKSTNMIVLIDAQLCSHCKLLDAHFEWNGQQVNLP
jgi:hypothetical protein